jgi:hypothetical protein
VVQVHLVRLAHHRQEVVALEVQAHQAAEAAAVEDNISHTLKDNRYEKNKNYNSSFGFAHICKPKHN